MSPDADPNNPNGKYLYVPRVLRDFYDTAVEEAEKLPEWSGKNFSRARHFSAVRVDR